MSSGFDRLRPRGPAVGRVTPMPGSPDPAGRKVLFSAAQAPPVPGSLSVECSSCGQTSGLSAAALLRAAVPSVHLPLLRGRFCSWLRCPACGKRCWVRLSLRL